MRGKSRRRKTRRNHDDNSYDAAKIEIDRKKVRWVHGQRDWQLGMDAMGSAVGLWDKSTLCHVHIAMCSRCVKSWLVVETGASFCVEMPNCRRFLASEVTLNTWVVFF